MAATVLAATVVAFALVSRRITGLPLTMPMVFVALGAATGGLGWIELGVQAEGVELLGEVALAVILFGDAVRIDVTALRREWGMPARLLGIGLPLTIVLGMLLAWGVLPGIGVWEAALVAAVLAPTDAALGQAVVEDEAVPQRIRQGLNVESGLNDGLALPAVLLFLALATGGRTDAGFVVFVAQQVGLGMLIGAGVGTVGGLLIRRALDRGWIEGIYAQLGTLGVAVIALAGASTVGANGFIAAFVGGLAFGATCGRAAADHLDEYTEDTGRLLAVVTFFVFGNVFVAQVGSAQVGPTLSWPVVLCAVLILTVGRLLPVSVALLGFRAAWPTVLFVGWFGPRGIASILFGLLLLREEFPAAEEIFGVVTVTVVASVVLHGATAAWGARRYGAWFAAMSDDHARMPESVPVTPHRVRWSRS